MTASSCVFDPGSASWKGGSERLEEVHVCHAGSMVGALGRCASVQCHGDSYALHHVDAVLGSDELTQACEHREERGPYGLGQV